jgi:hypothetical protein
MSLFFSFVSRHFPGRTEENYEILVWITDLPAEIQTEHLPIKFWRVTFERRSVVDFLGYDKYTIMTIS